MFENWNYVPICLPFLCVWNLKVYMPICCFCFYPWVFTYLKVYFCLEYVHVWRYVCLCLNFWGLIVSVWMSKLEPWSLSFKCKSKGLCLWVWNHMYVCPHCKIITQQWKRPHFIHVREILAQDHSSVLP